MGTTTPKLRVSASSLEADSTVQKKGGGAPFQSGDVSSKTRLVFDLKLQDWIPDAEWEIRSFSLAVLKDGRAVYQKPSVSLDSALTWSSSAVTVKVDLDEPLAPGTYQLQVEKTFFNLPGRRFPDETLVGIVVKSGEFEVTD